MGPGPETLNKLSCTGYISLLELLHSVSFDHTHFKLAKSIANHTVRVVQDQLVLASSMLGRLQSN